MALSLDDYQIMAQTTAKYPKNKGLMYTALNLNAEAGEIAGPLAKLIRKGLAANVREDLSEDLKLSLAKEAGDVLWELSAFCYELGFNLSDIAQMNLDKLAGRDARGTIHGNGDNR